MILYLTQKSAFNNLNSWENLNINDACVFEHKMKSVVKLARNKLKYNLNISINRFIIFWWNFN